MIERVEPDFLLNAPREELVKFVYELLNENKELYSKIETMADEITEIKARLNKDSHNSSKPPSSDGYKKPSPKSSREKGVNPIGGKSGHKGATLRFAQATEPPINHEPISQCECGCSLENVEVAVGERRQVHDIPPQKLIITNHQSIIKRCPGCGKIHRGAFPKGITQPVQYGEKIKALIVYLSIQNLIPLRRASQIVRDLFGGSFSEPTILSAVRNCAEALKFTNEQIKQGLINSPVAHFDETGLRINNGLDWLHSASNKSLTYYFTHEKRGNDAIDDLGILTAFKGIAVHDFWKSYFKYDCEHALCNAHLLRELTAIDENDKQAWAPKMKKLLLDIKAAVDADRQKGLNELDASVILDFETRYQENLNLAFRENPEVLKSGKRGRPKQTVGRNLALRFDQYRVQILRFMRNFTVPFDNNRAEGDIRMMKVRQKVSGCFRTSEGAKDFCAIRGYLSTMRKQGHNALDVLVAVFRKQILIPKLA
jgi:transposase